MLRLVRLRLQTMRRAAAVVLASALLAALVLPAAPASAGSQITGAGSTWSQIAVDQWRADIARQGVSVNFQGVGSSAGRQFYIHNQVDFAVSEIPFQGPYIDRSGTPVGDEKAAAAQRPYAYMPIVAGGTSLMYHLTVNGKQIRDLRLSGRTVARIFTGGITNWDDPAITHDDGRHFPNLKITPVVRSDGSGTSAQFTAYLSKMFPDVWNPFCQKYEGIKPPCGLTSLYPYFPGYVAAALSDGVANYVAAPYNNGAITYVEYGYALERNYPVVSLLNQAGYYRQPTAENVAIALAKARINPDRTQVLDGVYTNPDSRAYPMSSYSYMIVPTSTKAPFNTSKGDTLGRFILYFLCTGQQKAKQLGYSPLPPNLVQFGFDAENLIPGAPKPPALKDCANPTITGGTGSLAATPPPPPSDKQGSTPPPLAGNNNSGGTNSSGQYTQSNTGQTNATTATTAATSGDCTTTGGSGTTTTTAKKTTTTTKKTTSTTKKSAAKKSSTTTTTCLAATDASSGGTSGNTSTQGQAAANGEAAAAAPISYNHATDGVPLGLYVFIALVMLLIVFAPPAISLFLRRRDPKGA